MDVKCLRCGEPWGTFYVTDEFTPEEKEKFFAGKGCPSCKDKEVDPEQEAAAEAIMSQYDPDQIDDFAADLDDFGFLIED